MYEARNQAATTASPHVSGPVVHVLAPAAFGGAESVVLHLCEALQRLGVGVIVAALGVQDSRTHPWLSILRDRGIRVECAPAGLWGKLVEHRWLTTLLTTHRAGVVHTHGYRADVAVLRGGAGHWRWVSTVHGFTRSNWRVRLFEGLDRRILHRADAIVCVSAKLERELRETGVPRHRLHVIRNAPRPVPLVPRIQARSQLNVPEDAFVVGWVGRMSHEKGPDRIPTLMTNLAQPAFLTMVGDGPLREATVAQLEATGVDYRWVGARSDIAQLLPAFDVLLLTSRTEGMPMVVLESMAAGIPVISFDVGDVGQAVDAHNGWLITPDDIRAFQEAMTSALSDRAALETRGRRAQHAIHQHFTSEGWAQTHAEVYFGTLPSGVTREEK